MTGLLSRIDDDAFMVSSCLQTLTTKAGDDGAGAASPIILLIYAGQRASAPERHEVDASGATSI